MAQPEPEKQSHSWALVQELLDRGDPAFVDELRRCREAERLGAFATSWFNDRRPAARRLLLEYLDKPLNAPRHEPLIKRLFKLSEAAGDDEVMGRFLVLFDRCIRRVERATQTYDRAKQQYVQGKMAAIPNTRIPRADDDFFERLDEEQLKQYEKLFLFSPGTRGYLRRRAWRYFRKLGKKDPQRYFQAIKQILPLYRDADCPDGLALLDNWGLVHILFHFSPALVSRPTGWVLAENHSLSQIAAAPMFPEVWKQSSAPLLELLDTAQARPVRQWAIQLLRQDFPQALRDLPLEKLIDWLGHPSNEMVTLAVDILRETGNLAKVGAERLIDLLLGARQESLEQLSKLVGEYVKPGEVSASKAVALAVRKEPPLVKLGFKLLKKAPLRTVEDCRALLRLTEAQQIQQRGEMVGWATEPLSKSEHFSTEWVLEYLDSSLDDVRRVGWQWLESEPRALHDHRLWQKLLESPHDDVRLKMVDYLQGQIKGLPLSEVEKNPLDVELVRLLWATVLLNVNRGSKQKPAVVSMLLGRLSRRPEEAETLLPLLGVALRSLRGPEFRAGLVGLLNWTRRHMERIALVQGLFPELKLAEQDRLSGEAVWNSIVAPAQAAGA